MRLGCVGGEVGALHEACNAPLCFCRCWRGRGETLDVRNSTQPRTLLELFKYDQLNSVPRCAKLLLRTIYAISRLLQEAGARWFHSLRLTFRTSDQGRRPLSCTRTMKLQQSTVGMRTDSEGSVRHDNVASKPLCVLSREEPGSRLHGCLWKHMGSKLGWSGCAYCVWVGISGIAAFSRHRHSLHLRLGPTLLNSENEGPKYGR